MKLKTLKKENNILFILLITLISFIYSIPQTVTSYSAKEVIEGNTVVTANLSFLSSLLETPTAKITSLTLNDTKTIEKEYILNIVNNGDLDMKLKVMAGSSNCSILDLMVRKDNGDLRYNGKVGDLEYIVNSISPKKQVNEKFVITYEKTDKQIECKIPIEINAWQEIFVNNSKGYSISKTENITFTIEAAEELPIQKPNSSSIILTPVVVD